MILRHSICIPTYNNPLTIEQTITSCLEITDFPILVIDDGSDIPILDLLKNEKVKSALQTQRLRILRSEKNQGKGRALQRGFHDLIGLGFTHMIALDGDGQHLPSEIEKLVMMSVKFPWDIIIGNRKLVSETVPEISKFGRKFSNFWVKFQTSQKVADSQCGFRVYPLYQLQTLKFWTKGFDFEIEVLIRLLWRGVLVHEVDIEVHYPKPEERVSHFDKFWDNVKISTLNTFLVIVSLLKTHKSPSEAGVAIGLGILVGCTPFYGFQTLIIAALSFFFRLNAMFLLIGSQISIPPLAPFLFVGSMAIGRALHVGRSESLLSHSANWLVGSLILGLILGLTVGVITYFLMRQNQKKKKDRRGWNGKTRGGKFGNWFLKTLVKNFGLKPAYVCLSFIVPYFYFFAPGARRSASEYWKVTMPDKGFWERQRLILEQLHTFAQTLLDRVYQSLSSEPRFLTRPHGMENILVHLREKKGLIIMTAHVGGWDISAALLKVDGFSGEFQMVQFENHGLTFNKVKEKADAAHLKELHSNVEDQPILNIRQWLSEGKPLGLMGDRPLGNTFELVPFFGKLVPIDCTPFRIAAACKVPLLFSFGFKGKNKTYDFFATEARYYTYEDGCSKPLKANEWAGEYAKCLEIFVRRYPNQWANFYPFWSTQPKIQSVNNLERELHIQRSVKSGSGSDSKPSGEKLSLVLGNKEEGCK